MVNNSNMGLLSLLNVNKWFKSGENTQAANPLNHSPVSANVKPPDFLIDQVTISNEAKRLAELKEEHLSQYLSQAQAALQRMEQNALNGHRMEPEEPQ